MWATNTRSAIHPRRPQAQIVESEVETDKFTLPFFIKATMITGDNDDDDTISINFTKYTLSFLQEYCFSGPS